MSKVFKSETTWFHYFSLKDSKNLNSLDIGLWEMGAKRRLNGVNKWKNPLKTFFAAAILHPLWKKVFKSETTSFYYFSPRIPKIQKVWTLDFRKWGKKKFKRSEQIKKICKKLFSPRQFYTLYEQKFSNLRPLLSLTFPQGFRKSRKFGHWA